MVTLYSADDVSKLIVSSNVENNNNINSSVTRDNNKSISASTSDSKTIIGIRLIWVSSAARREGIAGRLVDCARQYFIYGSVVNRDAVAFSQPTREGFAFGTTYCQSTSILGY